MKKLIQNNNKINNKGCKGFFVQEEEICTKKKI